ncbi:hypothetical protein [Streptomyces sp. NPDC005548]|uniref:ATP-dependent DNA ligase n=1 Tax=Streptomyces sp. NPDC005548 TaxID=3364724 RepID=UPI00369525E9
MEWRLPAAMLTQPVESLPTEPSAYEAKWDGFRAIVSRNPAGAVEIRSRQGTLLNPGFPEITAAARNLPPVILDGEIVIWRDGRLAFERLLRRLNRRPAFVEARRQERGVAVISRLDRGYAVRSIEVTTHPRPQTARGPF